MSGERPIAAVILAAGEGKRMKSGLAKVLHTIRGTPMIRHVVSAVRGVSPDRIVAVVGHQAEAVMRELEGEGIEFALQRERLGTGHAVMQTRPLLGQFDGTLIVLTGDTPLLTRETLRSLVEYHRGRGASATVLSAVLDDAAGYGRIVRDQAGDLLRIVEHKDATEQELLIREINSGIFCFEREALYPALERVDRRNVQGEYYLTDVMEILRRGGQRTAVHGCPRPGEVIGVNDLDQLAQAERILGGDG
jgi:bifunctional UDP-N-acetylglucosamine pyrophosphorylase/glucosamine-1-phosphate N-acetyltransferase